MLAQYVNEGVDELDQNKLGPLLIRKYHAPADNVTDLGRPEQFKNTFTDFLKYRYQGARAISKPGKPS